MDSQQWMWITASNCSVKVLPQWPIVLPLLAGQTRENIEYWFHFQCTFPLFTFVYIHSVRECRITMQFTTPRHWLIMWLNLSYLMNMIFYVTVIFQFYTKLKGAVAIFTLIHDRQFIALYITELYSARLYSNIVIVTNGLLSCTIIVP